MLKALVARFKEGCGTGAFPPAAPKLPPDFKGRPEIAADTTEEDVKAMRAVCPVADALFFRDGKASLDMGRCIFCGRCAEVCGKVRFTGADADLCAGGGDGFCPADAGHWHRCLGSGE